MAAAPARRMPWSPARAFVQALARLPRAGLHARLGLAIGGSADRPLRMHILRPRRKTGPLPAVVYVFGGSWSSGSIDQGLAGMALLALRGFVTACIDYRLSTEARFPSQLQDCATAVRYLRDGGCGLGVDAARIGAIGLSAGGYLAALLATTAAAGVREAPFDVTGAGLQAVVTWCAPTDLLALSRAHGNPQSSETAQARLLGCPPLGNERLVARANPLTYVSAASPPFLLLHGSRDRLVPPSQSRLLHEALTRAGARSRLVLLPGKGHGFLGLQALRQTVSFLEQELRG